MPPLQTLLEGVGIGAPIGRGSLRLVPMFRTGPSRRPLEYLLGIDALAQHLIRIAEVSEEGSTPELLVTSEADLPVLLLEGEELVGAMQNRLADTDVLIGPHSSTRIPVSCCEEGRWSLSQPELEAGTFATPLIRAAKTLSVSRSLQTSAIVQSDQAVVWQEIDSLLKRTGTTSVTKAMSACLGKRDDYLWSVLDRCSCPAGAAGVVAIVNGRFATLDLFDRPETLSRLWPRLTNSYAADTIGTRGVAVPETMDIIALAILETLRKMECVVRDGVGLGTDWRFESPDLFGAALTVENTVVHLSAFPKPP